MSVGNSRLDAVQVDERWGSGNPPRDSIVESRIRRMLGRAAKSSNGGELLNDTPEAVADRVVEFLRERELL